MTHGLAVAPEHLDIIRPLLAKHLPEGTRVWAYGSRATGRRIWQGSDLDLMLQGAEALPFGVLGMLSDDLSESLLPYIVDLHDWHRTSADFLERIRPDLVSLPMAEEAPPHVPALSPCQAHHGA